MILEVFSNVNDSDYLLTREVVAQLQRTDSTYKYMGWKNIYQKPK